MTYRPNYDQLQENQLKMAFCILFDKSVPLQATFYKHLQQYCYFWAQAKFQIVKYHKEIPSNKRFVKGEEKTLRM